MKTILSLIITIFLLTSCYKDPIAILNPTYPGVDPELWPHFQNFEKEAARRGINIDLSTENLTGEIDNIHERGVLGVCQYGSAINNHITIDEPFWNSSGSLYREFVVFHELGHCVLFRDHDESMNGNGICLSIMRSGTGQCRDAYTDQNRGYYLDELFSID